MNDYEATKREYDHFCAGIEAEYEQMYEREMRYWSDRADLDAALAQLDQWRGDQLFWAACHYFGDCGQE